MVSATCEKCERFLRGHMGLILLKLSPFVNKNVPKMAQADRGKTLAASLVVG
jgi:hypothetical protein